MLQTVKSSPFHRLRRCQTALKSVKTAPKLRGSWPGMDVEAELVQVVQAVLPGVAAEKVQGIGVDHRRVEVPMNILFRAGATGAPHLSTVGEACPADPVTTRRQLQNAFPRASSPCPRQTDPARTLGRAPARTTAAPTRSGCPCGTGGSRSCDARHRIPRTWTRARGSCALGCAMAPPWL